MKRYDYPHTITNKHGETLIFREIVLEDGVEKLIADSVVAAGAGPPMHVHYKQAESLTVTEGEMSYQILGQEPVTVGVGDTAMFEVGVPHKFWNSGKEVLKCTGWVKPAHHLDYFLTEMYKAIDEGDGERPEPFASAYLTMRYKTEFAMLELPGFVRKVIIPVTYFIGKLLGKYKRFEGSPEPLV